MPIFPKEKKKPKAVARKKSNDFDLQLSPLSFSLLLLFIPTTHPSLFNIYTTYYNQKMNGRAWAMLFMALMIAKIGNVESVAPTCVATYHSIGIYWKAQNGSEALPCLVKYRKDGTSSWKNGLDLVWESRPGAQVTAYLF